LVLLAIDGGCGNAAPGSPATTSAAMAGQPMDMRQLREKWLRDWAYRTRPSLGAAYECFLSSDRNGDRGDRFQALTLELADAAHRTHSLSGLQCLEILGVPEFWELDADGEAQLVFSYVNQPDRKRWEAIFTIDASGIVTEIGWNAAGVNDYRKLGFHSGRG
jgi:hypothetical protein